MDKYDNFQTKYTQNKIWDYQEERNMHKLVRYETGNVTRQTIYSRGYVTYFTAITHLVSYQNYSVTSEILKRIKMLS